ncbi:MAG: putative DNA binding domain-containing protein [Propionibacteriaceae bacterium]|nr:putative DNA binding domain-containing protein [Propionibacteriaceae bacterium]
MQYRQRDLFEADPELATTKPEDQWFDRKSVRIEPTALANVLVAFANADGGTVIVGVENSGDVTGIDRYVDEVNRLRQAAINFTAPHVRHTTVPIACVTSTGLADHLLVLEIHPSDYLHRNHRGEVYKRVGDQTRRLDDDDVRELAFDKGERPFDGLPVPDTSMRDLDPDALQVFAARIGAERDVDRALRVRGLVSFANDKPIVNWGAILLFGIDPQSFLPGASIRILRYECIRPQPGTRSNLVFDRRIGGRLPEQIESARQVMFNQLREVTRLDEDTGQFVTIAELPRFAWLEAIVNAVTHRSYSLQGDHVRVSLFDDRMEVASPGRLPGPVRIDNIRQTRFSRNRSFLVFSRITVSFRS